MLGRYGEECFWIFRGILFVFMSRTFYTFVTFFKVFQQLFSLFFLVFFFFVFRAARPPPPPPNQRTELHSERRLIMLKWQLFRWQFCVCRFWMDSLKHIMKVNYIKPCVQSCSWSSELYIYKSFKITSSCQLSDYFNWKMLPEYTTCLG